jgi:MerR family transcriptional regulator, light-induced transcriptional regulator
MASVYGFVRSIARVGAIAPSLRSIVGMRQPDVTMPDRDFAALVEQQIIPRLVLAHGDDQALQRAAPAVHPITVEEVLEFAPMALDHDARVLLDYIEGFLDRGVSVDTIFVDLLAPAARHLGTMWEDDTADFVAVTMALWRLQETVRELSARVPMHGTCGPPRHVLCSVLPGEQHSFGTVLIEDMFRRAGWQSELVTDCDTSKLLGLVARTDYDLICLTATSACETGKVASIVNGLRSVSRNPQICIMVGGHAFTGDPARARSAGADGSADTATEALALAAQLVDERVVQRSVSA